MTDKWPLIVVDEEQLNKMFPDLDQQEQRKQIKEIVKIINQKITDPGPEDGVLEIFFEEWYETKTIFDLWEAIKGQFCEVCFKRIESHGILGDLWTLTLKQKH